MAKIKDIKARQVLDSRGNPTVEVDVYTSNGFLGRSIVPSGASTGAKEALELRDKGERYNGKSVYKAVEKVNYIIAEKLKGVSVVDQKKVDQIMIDCDGSENKQNLGANAILAVSMSCARAAALELNEPLYNYLGDESSVMLPVPMMNILNGGQHANNTVDIQEFMIMPVGAKSYSEALMMGVEIFHSLKKVLTTKGYDVAVGDEGGFAPSLRTNVEAIDLILEACQKSGYTAGKDILFALDVAASELYSSGYYNFKGESVRRSSQEMITYYEELCNRYPIISIEDGLDETDWEGWKELTKKLGKKIQLVGDDLFVTNPLILEKGIKEEVANAILIKVNQIGTLTETLEAIKVAKANHYNYVISHRSGESEDTFISDLAVATGSGQIKTGSLCRTDRVAKYNQLLRIEEQLNSKGKFPGRSIFKNF